MYVNGNKLNNYSVNILTVPCEIWSTRRLGSRDFRDPAFSSGCHNNLSLFVRSILDVKHVFQFLYLSFFFLTKSPFTYCSIRWVLDVRNASCFLCTQFSQEQALFLESCLNIRYSLRTVSKLGGKEYLFVLNCVAISVTRCSPRTFVVRSYVL